MKIKKIILPAVIVASFALIAFAFKKEPQKVIIQGQEVTVGINIGNKAPEIKLNDPNGKSIVLSDLKGKIVLVDFWASWCGPCRRENPNVVKTYEQFKSAKFENGNGFTVYSVSLDKNVKGW